MYKENQCFLKSARLYNQHWLKKITINYFWRNAQVIYKTIYWSIITSNTITTTILLTKCFSFLDYYKLNVKKKNNNIMLLMTISRWDVFVHGWMANKILRKAISFCCINIDPIIMFNNRFNYIVFFLSDFVFLRVKCNTSSVIMWFIQK